VQLAANKGFDLGAGARMLPPHRRAAARLNSSISYDAAS
jgi:hypothetical protein